MKLVIGYGNDLRRDDGVGRRLAEKINALRLSEVVVYSVHQLTPELAEPLGKASLAVFLDARLPNENETGTVHVEPIGVDARVLTGGFGHFGDPRQLLRLTHLLYGRVPQAWRVTLPACDFDFGEALSETASDGLRRAVGIVVRLLEKTPCTN